MKVTDVSFGNTLLPQIILGHLPFIGESYQGRSKNQMYLERFSDVNEIVKIVLRAMEYGIDVLSAPSPSDGKVAQRYFKAIDKVRDSLNVKLRMIPCIGLPIVLDGKPIHVYRRWLTYLHFEKKLADELEERYINDPILQCRENWVEDFPRALQNLKPYSDRECERLEIDFKTFDDILLQIRDYDLIFVELGSETDFLSMVGRIDLIGELIEHVERICNVKTLLGIHHAGVSIPILDDSGLDFVGYLTPINPLGVMMFPTPDLAIKAIKNAKKPIIAIKPFAGGRVKPKDAFQYIFNDIGVNVCMIGVASIEELDEDIRIIQQIFKI
ncbi:MAG: hypothetical protein RMJ31_04690 [Nitrososphaerota archaeon]|nr:hypothetical protein [Nitrososphaerales archaeon]MDW8045052.1 hypothetical protein [Nitrososphaerota archaeon]